MILKIIMRLCECGNYTEGGTDKCASCNQKERKKSRKVEPKRYKIRKVSKKRAKQLSQYNKLREHFLLIYQQCQVPGCGAMATEVHHAKGRENELLLDTTFWVAICSRHHTYYTEHSNEAIEKGISVKRNGKD